MRGTLAERLNSRLIPAPDAPCLLWTGCTNSRGYGVIGDGSKRVLVHRAAWQLEHGPIADGMTIDHVWDRGCRYKLCAPVAHLEPVTGAVNLQRSHRSNPRIPRRPYHQRRQPDPDPAYLAMLAAWLGDPADLAP